ncbi:MAG: extracellular solute-binding protein [Anaerolineales bacterium]|nr:extracellular solute-binding protein [Anaerolineales bacterium]
MKKLISLLFLVSIILTSCSAEGVTSTAEVNSTQSSSETPAPEMTLDATSRLGVNEEALNGLEIKVWTPWYGVESSLFDSLVKEFNSQNEWGIIVTAQSQVNFTNLYESVTASLPTLEKPDIAIALPEHALGWNADGVLTDLTPYVDDPKYGIDSSDIPFAFWSQDITSEARVGIPAQRTAQFLLWNETWAGELGFASSPGTSDDFKQQACGAHQSMLKDASAENDFAGGWIVDTEPMTAYAWLLAFQGGIVEGDGYRFLTPNNIDAFKFLRELSETSCAWQATTTLPSNAFANRQALFITASLEDLPDVARAFASSNNNDQWKVIPFPGETIVVYGSSYVILESTDEEQLASWLFVRWLLDNKQDARWVETTHLFPIHTSTVDLLGDYKQTHPQWAQAIELLPLGELQPQAASWRTVKVMLGDGFTHLYRVNVPSGQVAAILAQMESLARDLND